VLRNRQQKHTANPLYAMLKKPTAQIAHLVFADTQATAKKPKEFALSKPTTRQ